MAKGASYKSENLNLSESSTHLACLQTPHPLTHQSIVLHLESASAFRVRSMTCSCSMI